MRSFWKVSRHFAERVLKRVDENPKHFILNLREKYTIFSRVLVHEFDDTKQLLVLKTVFKR